MRPDRLLRVVLAVLLVATGCASASSGVGGRTGEHAGFSPGAALLGGSPDRVAADLDAVRDSGARWLRVDIDWSQIERSPGSYDTAALDRVVGGAAARGLRVLGLIAYTPDWARPADTTDKHPPSDPAAMARFATYAADRWGPSIAAWEIWNEPNLRTFWSPGANPEVYAGLLKAVVPALRSATPTTPVISGGLSPARTGDGDMDPIEYLTAVYEAGGGALVDGVGAHPYSYPAFPTDPTTLRWNFFARLPMLRVVIERYGRDEQQVWITEFGAPTGAADQAVDAELQASIVRAGLEEARDLPWVALVLLYSLRDSGTDPADREQNFGVLAADGEPKPAWDVVRDEFGRGWR